MNMWAERHTEKEISGKKRNAGQHVRQRAWEQKPDPSARKGRCAAVMGPDLH